MPVFLFFSFMSHIIMKKNAEFLVHFVNVNNFHHTTALFLKLSQLIQSLFTTSQSYFAIV